MPIEIFNTATGAAALVHPISNGAYVTMYRSDGQELNGHAVGTYILPVNMRQGAGTAAGNIVWAFQMGSERMAKIRQIAVSYGFDGTGATSTGRYGIRRYYGNRISNATGTAITAIKLNSTMPGSGILDARFLETGLTTTGVLFETDDCYTYSNRRSGTSTLVPARITPYHTTDISLNDPSNQLILMPREGLCFRLNVAAVAGDTVTGFVMWDEFQYYGI